MRTLLICMTTALGPLGGPSLASAQESEERTADPSDFAGSWIGSLNVGAMQLRMRFEFSNNEGMLDASVFSVDQGDAEVPVASVTLDGATVAIAMPMAGATYEGTLSADGTRIEGSFAQMGSNLSLNLERSAEGADTRRPQDPIPPLPYMSEDVSYPNPDGGHTLAGTFTRPESDGPFPAVILISGSGPQDRDEALLGHRPFLVLSDHLTRSGIAVLRFDDRGVGESTGDFGSATSRDFASDVLAGVAYLMARDDVDTDAIGLAGHSEGGLIAPMVAVESDDVAFVVLMAGTGVNGERILYTQGALIARASGASEEAIRANQDLQRAIFAVVKAEPDPGRAGEMLTELVRTALEEAGEEARTQAGVTDDASLDGAVAAQVQAVNTPWFRFFLTYEPAETIERLTVPVLAINGENDLQVPYEENLREIEAALRRGGNTEYEIYSLPGLNHLFQYSETGSPSEYQAIEETWSVEVMELIAEWILETAGSS